LLVFGFQLNIDVTGDHWSYGSTVNDAVGGHLRLTQVSGDVIKTDAPVPDSKLNLISPLVFPSISLSTKGGIISCLLVIPDSPHRAWHLHHLNELFEIFK
jgi:hypothetical protein